MIDAVFSRMFIFLEKLDAIIWERLGIILIILTGLYLTFLSRGLQFRILFSLPKHFKDVFLKDKCDLHSSKKRGVSPIGIYFASVGGMVGIGNIVGVITAITIGGPGSLFWMWISSFIGMLVKYSEIYLGVKYRKYDEKRKIYAGGPMYYIREAFQNFPRFAKILSLMMCLLFCFYGVEISQFVVVVDTIEDSFSLNRYMIIISLIVLIILSAKGGVKWLTKFCSILMPPFMLSYVAFVMFIVVVNYAKLGTIFREVFVSAFTFSSSAGGLIGSSLVAASYGVARSVYSGDIGIGYDSILHSETKTTEPEKQAKMAIFSLLSDTLICSMSVMVVLVTETWRSKGLISSQYVVEAFYMHFPRSFVDVYIAVLFFISGITTIIGYFIVGNKAAYFLSERWGCKIYLIYTVCAFVIFSFLSQEKVMLLMSISGGLLMIMNIIGMFPLFRKVKFR